MAPRVLFFLPSLQGYRDRVAMLLEASGHLDRLTLLVGRLDDELPGPWPESFRLITAGWRPGQRWRNSRRLTATADALLAEEHFDILHDTFGGFLPLARRRRRPFHLCTSLYHLSAWRLRHAWGHVPAWRLLLCRSTAMMFYARWVERRICHAADTVVLQAEGLKAWLREEIPIPLERLRVLPNNIDADFWKPSSLHSRKSKPGPLRLLFVGGVSEARGLYAMLDLIEELHRRGTAAQLVLVGGVSPFDRQRLQARLAGRPWAEWISLPGRVSREEVRRLMHTSDLFVYHTLNDGSPRVVLEAMAAAVPVLGSNHPGIAGLDPSGQFLHLGDYGDVKTLLAQITSYLANPEPYHARALAGSRHVREHHSAGAIGARYANFYAARLEETEAA